MLAKDNEEESQKPSFDSLLKDFLHPNPIINQRACMQMVTYWPEESRDIFLTNLDSKDLVMRRKCVKALGVFGKAIFSKIVSLYYSTDNVIIQVSCLKIFVQIVKTMNGEPFPGEAMRVIESAIENDSPELLLTVIPLLRLLGNQGLPLLIESSKDDNVLKALASVMAISEFRDSSARKQLELLSSDSSLDKLVRDSSKKALRNFKDLN